MPFILNPEQGYIATANNKTVDDSFPYYISGLWADPSRAERIVERLARIDKAGMDDMKSIQLDYTSRFASEIVPYFLIARLGNETGRLKTAYEIIENWDFVESSKSQGALIFHAVLRRLVLNLYGDEMELLGNHYLKAFTEMKYLHSRNLRDLLSGGTSSWIDDIRTKNKVEELGEILRRSFSSGVDEIVEHVGLNTANWQWGRAHSITHKHELGKFSTLNWIFNLNVGSYPSGGSDKSPNAGGYSFNDPYKQIAGASMRRVVDFSNLNETQFILPTGQSGLPRSRHYRDQADLYHSGQYRTTWFDETFIRRNNQLFKRLVLVPEK
jgi:penicillin amidase